MMLIIGLLLALLLQVALIVVVVVSRHRHPTRSRFLVYLCCSTVWLISLLLLSSPPSGYLTVVIFGSSMAGIAASIALILFCQAFPVWSPVDRWYKSLRFPVAILPVVIAGVWLHFPHSRVVPLTASYWILCCSLYCVFYVGSIIKRARGRERLQLQYMLLGLLLLCLGEVIEKTGPLLTGQQMSFYLQPCLGLAFLALTTYVLLGNPLIGLDRIIQQSVIFLSLLGIIALVFTFAIKDLSSVLFYLLRFSRRGGFYLVTALLGLVFLPVYARLLHWSNRWRYLHHLDPAMILHEAEELFDLTNDPQGWAATLKQVVTRFIMPEHLSIFVPYFGGTYRCIASTEDTRIVPDYLDNKNTTVGYIIFTNKPLITDYLIYQLGAEEHEAWTLKSWDIALACPLSYKKLRYGFLLLGEKRSGGAYTREDLQFFSALCVIAANAYHRIHSQNELLQDKKTQEQVVAQQREQLTTTSTRLQQIDRANDHFLAILSHELLSPLTSILGWADVGLQSSDNEVTSKALGVILNNARRQKRLVDDLLDVSRMNYQKLHLERNFVDLWELAKQSIEGIQQQTAERRIDLRVVPPENAMPVFADASRMLQVFTNLLANAIKFTDPQGTITVTGTCDGLQAWVEVRDTGIGITAGDLETIFELFNQGAADKDHGKGLGLGLALVQGIVNLHDGTITAESPGIGFGSTFCVKLPCIETRRREKSPDSPADEEDTAILMTEIT